MATALAVWRKPFLLSREDVTCVVQARMGSTRLPGKVLAPVAGRPMLRFMLDRLSTADVGRVVVATSSEQRDDTVAEVAEEAGVAVIRGSEGDVLDRFRAAVEAFPSANVIRLTGDCPLTDPAVVAATLDRHLELRADYTCNVLPRTFPKGLDVEVISTAALLLAAREARDGTEREHVTPFLYRYPERFRLANLWCPEDLGEERWTVDTAEDLEFVRSAVKLVGPDELGWEEILRAVGRRCAPEPGTLRLRPAREADSDLLLKWRNDPDAVRFSGTGQAVEVEQHRSWVRSRLADPAGRIWIGTVDGRAVGFVRLDVEAAIGLVSLAVDRSARGHGYGVGLLRELRRTLRSDLQVVALRAKVDTRNTRSILAFERVGFRRYDEVGGLFTFVRDMEDL